MLAGLAFGFDGHFEQAAALAALHLNHCAGQRRHQFERRTALVVHEGGTDSHGIAGSDVHLGHESGEIAGNHRNPVDVDTTHIVRIGGTCNRQIQSFANLYFHCIEIYCIFKLQSYQLFFIHIYIK